MPKAAREIAEAIGYDMVIVCHALPKLLKFKEIKSIEVDRINATNILGRKVFRRTNFFFTPDLILPVEFQELVHFHSE